MNFLGMGPMELMVILVLALIVFGPGKLPEIAGQVGRVVRDFRRTTAELSSEFNRTLSLELEERKAAEAPEPPAPVAAYESNPASGTAVADAGAPTTEPAEAPTVVTTSTEVSTAVETPPPAPVAATTAAANSSVATKRRTIDADLAPPY